LCFVSALCVEIVDHGSRRGDEALGVLHRAMRLASYRCIAMAIEITIDSSAFFVAVDSLSPTDIAK
jgi:hypothetical protein